jgi:N-hydroxyarylamine O-acetyltransferase
MENSPGGAEGLPPALLERVLQKLGFADRPIPDADGLRLVYAAWCHAVPFDNFQKLIHLRSGAPGDLPGDRPEDFFTRWLENGTGGTCWAGNGALVSLLADLGFPARRGLASMLGAVPAPGNHGTVVVEFDRERFLTDASMLYGEPLPLLPDAASRVEHPAWRVECTPEGAAWRIRYHPLHHPEGADCRIERFPVDREEFHARHERTRGWSFFNYSAYFRTIRGESMLGLAFGQRVEIDGTGKVTAGSLTEDERRRFLVDDLGVRESLVARLPADLPIPPRPTTPAA